MVLNLGAVALFAVNALVRTRVGPESKWPLGLSLIGIVGVLVSGWLGGEMVYVERVGVEERASAARIGPAAWRDRVLPSTPGGAATMWPVVRDPGPAPPCPYGCRTGESASMAFPKVRRQRD